MTVRSIEGGGARYLFVGPHFPASSCSRSRILVVFGRADGESVDSNSSDHIWVNNVHNPFENPTAGRSGRTPPTTFVMTAASELACSKGLRPVITYRKNLRYVTGAAEATSLCVPLELSFQEHIYPCSSTATFSGRV